MTTVMSKTLLYEISLVGLTQFRNDIKAAKLLKWSPFAGIPFHGFISRSAKIKFPTVDTTVTLK